MEVSSSPDRADGVVLSAKSQPPHAAAEPPEVPRKKRSKAERALRRIGWNLLPPLTFIAIVGLWWAAVEIFRIPAYLLPGPKGVFARLVSDAGLLWTHSQVTLTEILLGFGITIVTAIPMGLLIALSPLSKQLVYPPIMLMQLVPKIAVAPLFLVWLGFGIESKVLLTVLLTFFPLLIASISGFQILDDRFLYLTKSMGATRWLTFRHLTISRGTPGHFFRDQDVRHHRRYCRHRCRVRRCQQGTRICPASRDQHDGYRARFRRACGAYADRRRGQLYRGV